MDNDDVKWIHQVFNAMVNDGATTPEIQSPTSARDSTKYRTVLQWIPEDEDITLPEDRKPPDDQRESIRAAIRHLQVQRTRSVKSSDTLEDWDYDGKDWQDKNGDGTWTPDDLTDSTFEDEGYNKAAASYFEMARRDHVVIHKVDGFAPDEETSQKLRHYKMQSDTGANVCATDRLELLQNVVWIEPSKVHTAKNDDPMTAVAIGQLPVIATGQARLVNCYYIPSNAGTIISPTAIVKQHQDEFCGYRKECNTDDNVGRVILIGRNESVSNWILPIICRNDLWWHVREDAMGWQSEMRDDATSENEAAEDPTMHISRLSDAAKYELWHQRLGHPGQYVMNNIHKHSSGVPNLRGNAFYKCPSCMSGKAMKQPSRRKDNLGAAPTGNPTAPKVPPAPDPHPDPGEEFESFLDAMHLPEAQNGQHWHIDLGFVRGSDYAAKDAQGRTVTSIDGKRAYVLIVDRASRYMWEYVSPTKDPPIEAVKIILEKFKSTNPHCTVRTDQDKSLGKSDAFKTMVTELGYTLELTGSDSSVQNSRAERPHRDLAQMMRCMLHAAALGSEHWSFALRQAVFIKNRVPHSSLKKSPYEALTGRPPDLSHLRVFGSRVYAKDPGLRPKKLDHHVSKGIYLGHSATPGNVYYKDDATGTIKLATHVFFDEAHMTTPAARRPLAAEALQRLGYHTRESWLDTSTMAQFNADANYEMLVEKLTPTAITPTRGTPESIGFDVHLDSEELTIEPGTIQLLPTGIAARAPTGTYIRVAPRSGLTVKRSLHTLAGVVDPDYTGNITVVMYNAGTQPQAFKRGDRIAQLIVERAETPTVTIVDQLPGTQRGAKGFGSTDKTADELKEQQIPPLPTVNPTSIPTAAAAARLEKDSTTLTPEMEQGLRLEFDIPYELELESCMYDSYTTREIEIYGKHDTLGMNMSICAKHGVPMLMSMEKSTPGAKVKRWRSELRNAYILTVNDTAVKTINDVKLAISTARQANEKAVKVGFATVERPPIHSQTGQPQMYLDQMNIIADHLWSLNNDPEWTEKSLGHIPVVEKMIEDEVHRTTGIKKDFATIRTEVINAASRRKKKKCALLSKVIRSVLKKKKSLKQQRKLTRRILQQQDDWDEWKASEWKQLDQYRDQDTFGAPERPPRDVNKLSLLWTYLVKDDGRRKARCVCNGSKKMRGSVTLAETYASALDQTASRVFWAATAIYNLVTIGADAANAFAEAPPPVAPLYVHVDEPYREWYKARYGKDIPKGHVMRVKKALQGHPESARLWALLIDKVIRELDLKPCTHEPNLYYTPNYANTGKLVLFLRQVDDFAIACQDTETADAVIEAINSKMTIEVKKLGMITRFNGVDVLQTRHYVKLSNATYIKKILANHPWLTHEAYPPSLHPLPMRAESTYQRKLELALQLTAQALDAKETELGFSYRQGIGEILYALITCRPDISYSTIKLSQYSTRPAAIHFDAVKEIYAYLRDTMDDGIYYWRKTPRMDLPVGPVPECRRDENYSHYDVETTRQDRDDVLVAAKDSDFAGDVSHRKSITGVVIKLAGGSVLYRTLVQQVQALSSTEAEFTAAAEAGKYILYLRTIMEEIGLMQEEATVLYEDNQGALLMANAQKPTKRTRHMSVKAFALQDWVSHDLISIQRINTSDNYSDAMTKALARTLFYRHNDYIMGRIVPEYMKDQLPRSQIKKVDFCIDLQSDLHI